MDIPEELQRIRRVLECPNVRKGFNAMARIDERIRKHAPLKPGRKSAAG